MHIKKQKKIGIGIVLLFAMLMMLFTSAMAKNKYPTPKGLYLNDYTNTVSAETKQHIDSLGAELANKTGAQLVFVVIDSLNGEPIEDYAMQIGRAWDVGDAQKKNGVVLVRAVEDKQVYVSVGDGLGGALPDGKVGRILDADFLPYSREGDLNAALTNTFDALAVCVANEYDVTLTGTDAVDTYGDDSSNAFSIIIGIIVMVSIFGFSALTSRRRGRRGRNYRSGPNYGGGYGGFGGGFGGGSSGGGGFSGGGGGGGFSGGGAGRNG